MSLTTVTWARNNPTTPPRQEVLEQEPLHRPGRAGVLVAATVVALAVAVVALPREHAALPAIARYALTVALPKWHTTEPVNEVVYGTRGFDTFGETFLLLAAVVAITTITRRKERRRGFIGEEVAGQREQAEVDREGGGGAGDRPDASQTEARSADDDEQNGGYPQATPDDEPLGTPAPERALAMSVVVRGAVRLTAPLLVVAGLYLVAWGYSPGGGFPGGLVMLGVVLLVYVAYGYTRVEKVIRPDVVEPIELGGALLIVVIEALGLVLKGSFSANFLPLFEAQTIPSGGILQAFSGAELIEVASGLTLAVFGLLGMGHDWSDPPERSDDPAGGPGPP